MSAAKPLSLESMPIRKADAPQGPTATSEDFAAAARVSIDRAALLVGQLAGGRIRCPNCGNADKTAIDGGALQCGACTRRFDGPIAFVRRAENIDDVSAVRLLVDVRCSAVDHRRDDTPQRSRTRRAAARAGVHHRGDRHGGRRWRAAPRRWLRIRRQDPRVPGDGARARRAPVGVGRVPGAARDARAPRRPRTGRAPHASPIPAARPRHGGRARRAGRRARRRGDAADLPHARAHRHVARAHDRSRRDDRRLPPRRHGRRRRERQRHPLRTRHARSALGRERLPRHRDPPRTEAKRRRQGGGATRSAAPAPSSTPATACTCSRRSRGSRFSSSK